MLNNANYRQTFIFEQHSFELFKDGLTGFRGWGVTPQCRVQGWSKYVARVGQNMWPGLVNKMARVGEAWSSWSKSTLPSPSP